ncbi:hypothetical protein ACN28I_21025 [Archangium gephyra]|uniref:hypothetical protein n=1 Tax=Archangium gephyra TaxID=48 RepID=UPI003B7E5E46
MEHTKTQRIQEFIKRLGALAPAASFAEAKQQLDDTLNAVEDEMTSIPFNPETWETDGRMYPVQPDNARTVPGHPSVKRLRSRGHNTFIGANGSIEIQAVGNAAVLFRKPGVDGKGVWEQ